MTTNYRRGADFERKVMDQLSGQGFATVRSAGSKSPADIVAVLPGSVLFVQCKRNGRMCPHEWDELYEWATGHGATPVVASIGEGFGGVIYELVTGRKVARRRRPSVVVDLRKLKHVRVKREDTQVD